MLPENGETDLVQALTTRGSRFGQSSRKVNAMKFFKILLVSALLISTVTARDALADRWHRGPRVGVGVVIGPYWGPYYSAYSPFAPYAFGYPMSVYYPPVVVEPTPPPVYIEQSSTEPTNGYWYYCQASRAYYPYVKSCPRGWIPVAPQPNTRP